MTVYEVVLEGRQGNTDMLNVFHYEVQTGETPDWQLGADELRSHIANRLATLSMNNVLYTGITVREDLPGHVGVFYGFTAGDIGGSNSTSSQSRTLAMLVRKRSLGGIRPVLGWFFVGGLIAENLTNIGLWNTATTDAVTLYANDITVLGAVAASDVNMVIKARNPTAPNTQPYSVVDVCDVTVIPRNVRSRRQDLGT